MKALRVLIIAAVTGVAAESGAQNLLVNGDFQNGNTGFETEYIYSHGNIWYGPSYDIVSDVSQCHPLSNFHRDHTSGTGLMMAVNGDGKLVWAETVSVLPATRYVLSAWVADWDTTQRVPLLAFQINGVPLTYWSSAVKNEWEHVWTTWDSGSAGSARVAIYSQAGWGDGIALDDLALFPAEPHPGWIQRGTDGPSARRRGALAYDSDRGVAVLFGGISEPFLPDTWEWNGQEWQWRTSVGPTARDGHVMAYDSARHVVVLFGGWVGHWDNSTWEWSGDAWALRGTSGPSARHEAAMAYDAARHVTVLFGGNAGGVWAGDTWEWDGLNWLLKATNGPAPRHLAAMAYDSARHVCVLFGGESNTGRMNDTWEWDGSTWQLRATGGPSPRYAHDMAYDVRRGCTWLFGGSPGNYYSDETWSWDGQTWTELLASGPAARYSAYMAYDTQREQVVLFGGANPYDRADTWELGVGELTTGLLATTADVSSWKATESEPAPAWKSDPDFDDTSWFTPVSVRTPDWIWSSGPNCGAGPQYAWFRTTFTLSDVPVSAWISGSMDDDGEIFINGYRVLADHDCTAAYPLQVDDVQYFLHPGTNLLAVAANDCYGVCHRLQLNLGFAHQRGDLNCDGLVNSQDIDGFIDAIFGLADQYDAYLHSFPVYRPCSMVNADFNDDGVVNAQDIDGFVAALFGG